MNCTKSPQRKMHSAEQCLVQRGLAIIPLSPGFRRAEGISHALRAFSLTACRGGPCKRFEDHGIARIPLSPGFRRAEGAPTSLSACRGGPCKRFEDHGIAGIPLSPGFRRAEGAPTSLSARRGGPCMAKRVLKMAIRCLLFDRSMSTMQLQSSVCQRIGNTVSFFCLHSMHIFIKIGRSGPYVSKMTTFCLYMAAGSVV